MIKKLTLKSSPIGERGSNGRRTNITEHLLYTRYGDKHFKFSYSNSCSLVFQQISYECTWNMNSISVDFLICIFKNLSIVGIQLSFSPSHTYLIHCTPRRKRAHRELISQWPGYNLISLEVMTSLWGNLIRCQKGEKQEVMMLGASSKVASAICTLPSLLKLPPWRRSCFLLKGKTEVGYMLCIMKMYLALQIHNWSPREDWVHKALN